MGINLHNTENLMTKKIAIFIDTEKFSGGAYHELMFFVKSFKKFNKKHNLEFVIIRTDKNILSLENSSIFKILDFNLSSISRYIHYLFNFHHFFRRIRKFINFENKFEKFLNNQNIDHVLFTGPSQYSLYIEKISYSIIIPDVAHRENVEFPELSSNPEFDRKDEILSKSLPRASFIITNSEIIKKRIMYFYRILEERILVISQRPSNEVDNFDIKKNLKLISDFRNNYSLPKTYIFYPAMYFPHKNHKLIIDAVESLIKKDIKISAVFCGKDKGYKKNLIKYTEEKKIHKNLVFLDFVEDKDLPLLYCNSFALVMPSLIGPTNIPPWEAFKLKVPVFYPDFGGIKVILKDAVYYIDPYNPEVLAEGILKILRDDQFKTEMIDKGEKLYNSIDTEKEFDLLFNFIEKVRKIRQRWIF